MHSLRRFLESTVSPLGLAAMSGQSDYMAEASTNFMTGQQPAPAIGNRFLALFTTAPTSDAGTGGTEVSGTAYARQQVAGAITAAGAISTAASTITMPNVSGYPWVVAGMNVYDLTNAKQIGTVLTWVTTTLTLTGNASNNGSGSTDSLQFSAWPAASASSGNEPATTPAKATNGAIITFPQAGATWGTVTSFAIYDALTSGNMLGWDYLGGYNWLPFSGTLATPCALTVGDGQGTAFATGLSCVVTAKFGGTLPTTSGSWAGVLTITNIGVDSFSVGVNSTSTGDGQVRLVQTQSIPQGITASFAASTLTISMA